ncbi:TetR/AcrR family transcriptional regulator [Paenibacillus pinihumi]|uniref:TetR/AcrR family transcriptional regulator n=1 Tax=Paenibacillus pinihumi TaxID=669462 RepID=UPI0004012586|nr:TetR/AcrR family transcriptional regulator [Paenibacillus pinihumi]
MARSKEFEESEVLHKAMHLFWEQGYEKTSMADLVEHMGIHRRSLYDTFGDKHALYMQAMNRYAQITNTTLEHGVKRSETAREAIQFIFDLMIEGMDNGPAGCLYVNAAVELGLRDNEANAITTEGFIQAEQMLAKIIQQGQEAGEFVSSRNADELAESLHNALIGIRVWKRATPDMDKLRRIAKLSMEILDR